MPKTEETIATRTRSQTPAPPKPASLIGKHATGGAANPSKTKLSDTEKTALKKVKDARDFNAEPSLSLDGTGICHINTGKMADRSTHEVYNYAYLINRYIEKQRGKKVKIKSTKKSAKIKPCFAEPCARITAICSISSIRGKPPNKGCFPSLGMCRMNACMFQRAARRSIRTRIPAPRASAKRRGGCR